MIRFFDIFLSVIGLIILTPLFLLISVLIILDSKGPVFFRQIRVGKFGNDFCLLKFRSMYVNSESKSCLTIGNNDVRVTRIGKILRRLKLDEFPQLINVLLGQMSLVGPRPEVRKYVKLYTKEQLIILSIKPGITDYASLAFKNENEILLRYSNPEEYYKNIIIPKKIKLNMIYIKKRNILEYLNIIMLTLLNTILLGNYCENLINSIIKNRTSVND